MTGMNACISGDPKTMLAAFNEEPEAGYILAKKMGDGAIRLYEVSVRLNEEGAHRDV